MTRTEKILIAGRNFTARRGHTVKDQVANFLRQTRRENRTMPENYKEYVIQGMYGLTLFRIYAPSLLAARLDAKIAKLYQQEDMRILDGRTLVELARA